MCVSEVTPINHHVEASSSFRCATLPVPFQLSGQHLSDATVPTSAVRDLSSLERSILSPIPPYTSHTHTTPHAVRYYRGDMRQIKKKAKKKKGLRRPTHKRRSGVAWENEWGLVFVGQRAQGANVKQAWSALVHHPRACACAGGRIQTIFCFSPLRPCGAESGRSPPGELASSAIDPPLP